MPGPPPKDPNTRQRRNRPATKAVLGDDRRRARVPPLPKRSEASKDEPGERPWHALTRLWWRELWRSPMSARFLRVEVHELVVVAQLRDDFHYATNARDRQALAGELRLQAQRWGLDQLARWRLSWEVPSDIPAPKSRALAEPDGPPEEPSPRADRGNVLSMLQAKRS